MQYVLELFVIFTVGLPNSGFVFFFKLAYIWYIISRRAVISLFRNKLSNIYCSWGINEITGFKWQRAKQTIKNCLMLENCSSSCLTSFALIKFFSLRYCESQHKTHTANKNTGDFQETVDQSNILGCVMLCRSLSRKYSYPFSGIFVTHQKNCSTDEQDSDWGRGGIF